MIISLYIYVMTDAYGSQSSATVQDPSDTICIGGYDTSGVYQQFDSYEAYHIWGWLEGRDGLSVQLYRHRLDTDTTRLEFDSRKKL